MSNPVLERLSNDTKKLAHDYIRHENDQNDDDIDKILDLETLKTLHDKLANQLNTAYKINKVLANQLTSNIKMKRKLWVYTQLLMDANIQVDCHQKLQVHLNVLCKMNMMKSCYVVKPRSNKPRITRIQIRHIQK